jgi:Mg/Co/Ni transporter MgtE
MPEDDQVHILEALGDERAADILDQMEPDDAADVLAQLPEEQREELLELMEPRRRRTSVPSSSTAPTPRAV